MKSWTALPLFLTTHGDFAQGWSQHAVFPRIISASRQELPLRASSSIDFQRDHGRGDEHLSAFLEEGDVVVYQTGTWLVDGVEVGDGRPPTYEWAKIDSLQVVWTHNCEHGVLRGIAVKEEEAVDSKGDFVRLCEMDPMEFIEFGPEQLVARVGVEWDDEEERRGTSGVPLGRQDESSFWTTEAAG